MNKTMKNNNTTPAYEAPQVEIIEVAVEKDYAQSVDDDPKGTIDGMPWHE
ncbi:MAG: hypothetical protein IJ511_05810 [Bacteroides sp.]|nr:hypothetical protein [Bacteroides sp.]